MNKIRIMHLLKSTKYSGAENVVCQIMELFKKDDRFEMVYVCPKGPIKDVLEKRDLSYFLLDSFSYKEVKQVVNKIKPSIIHAHDFSASVLVSFIKKVSVISHIHNNPLWLSKICLNSVVYACSLKRYAKIIGVSSSVIDEFRFKGLMIKKFEILPNVIDKEKVLKMGEEKFDEQIDILFVGRMAPPKNPLAFVSIINKVIQRYNKLLSVIMVGEGPMFDRVQTSIRQQGLSSIIKLMGFEKNPYKYMKNSKMLIMPSVWEGFGLVAIESMLLKTPVIASPVGGLKDIITGGSGFLCKDEDSMVLTVLSLLEDEEKRKQIGYKGFERALFFSNVNNYKKQLEDIYYSIDKNNNE